MKFISWNVNGLRAIVGKGFERAFHALDADFVCIQEIRMQEGQLDLAFSGYSSYWNYAEKKGYSGTCIFTRQTPLTVTNGIGVPDFDAEGRAITLEMPDFYLVNVYVPTSQDRLIRLPYRLQWEDAFRSYLSGLSAKKSVIVGGDLNVAHKRIDLAHPSIHKGTAGFTDEERGKMTDLLASGFIDSWRSQHREEVKYSWWPQMKYRDDWQGWRLDYFLVSTDLKDRIESTDILDKVYGSDHCPVQLIMAF